MRAFWTWNLAAAALAALALPAAADAPAALAPQLTTEHQQALRVADTESAPYALNYADQAAQSLGMANGRWEAFDTGGGDALLPALKGGIDNGAAMLKLQWQPGR